MYSLDIHNFAAAPNPTPPTLRRAGQKLSTSEIDHVCRWVRSQYVVTDEVRHVHDVLDATLNRNDRTKSGSDAPIAKHLVVVTGANGSGKSRCVQEWVRARYRATFGEMALTLDSPVRFELQPGVLADWVPYMWINIGTGDGSGAIDRRGAEFFGLPDTGAVDKVGRRARAALRRHRVTAMVLDDAHMATGGSTKYRSVADHLKSTNSELGVTDTTMILVGADLFDHRLLADPQIAARARVVEITPYAIDDDDGRAHFQSILQQVEQTLGEHIPIITPGLLSTKHIGLLHHRVQGYLGDTLDLITEATQLALYEGASTVNADHITKVGTTLRAQRRQREMELTYTRELQEQQTAADRVPKRPARTKSTAAKRKKATA
ncbi:MULTISPECIES: TniB family NTP-binding protein [Gordonia]